MGSPGPARYHPLHGTFHCMITVGGCVFSFRPQIFIEPLCIPGHVLGTVNVAVTKIDTSIHRSGVQMSDDDKDSAGARW